MAPLQEKPVAVGEKNASSSDFDVERASAEVHRVHDSVLRSEALGAGAATRSGLLGTLWGLVRATDKFGVEARGIERVMRNERTALTKMDLLDNLWMWLAANCTISTLALGALGTNEKVFALTGKDAVLVIIFFNLLSTLPVAYFSTWGPRLGLRQMTITRFSFGYYAAWFPTVLNVIATIGWSVINTIVGGLTLHAVDTTHKLPVAAGIVIIALLTFVCPFFGYKVVHTYERYAWLPVALTFLIMVGLNGKDMRIGSVTSEVPAAGSVLSFGATITGFGVGWSSYAADYTVQLQENVSAHKVFWLNYIGLNIPLILIESLGAGLMTVSRGDFQDRISTGNTGDLLAASLSPVGGFGQFLLVILAISIVANNIPNMYSFALTFQVLGKFAQSIPRIILVLLGTVVYIVLAIIGASHFESALDTLLVILSYWLSIYCVILTEEHLIFRKGSWINYNANDYNNPLGLPLGVAAGGAVLFGIMGAVLGMAQVWFIGPLGKKIDPVFGGDIGFELAAGFSGVTYPIFRMLERRFESPRRMAQREI